MRALFLSVALILAWVLPAAAADVRVEVRGADGKPVPDAVVTVQPAAGARPPAPGSFPWAMRMAQHNIQFEPFVLVVPVNSDVVFPNLDNVRHHVYSFSPTKKFELKLYGREEARTVRFDKAGVVALGCNIHDQMTGFIYVTDTPYAAKTDAAGVVVLKGVPAGAATLTVWHPYLRAPKNLKTQPLSVGAGSIRQVVTIELRPPAGAHAGH